MKHINSIGQFRDVYHPECTNHIPYPDFTNAGSDRRHRFPIIRVATKLYLLDLISSLLSHGDRKTTQVIQSATKKLNGLMSNHRQNIQISI